MAVELAVAYVSLAVSARGLLDKVKAELGGPLDAAARNAGDRAGGQLGRGLAGAAKTAGRVAGKDLADGVSAGATSAAGSLAAPLVRAARAAGDQAGDQLGAGLTASAQGTGVEAGRALVRGVDSGLDGLNTVGDELGPPLVAAARKAGVKAGDGLSDGLVRSAGNAGRKAGDALEDGLSSRVKRAAVGLAAVFASVQVGGFLKGAVDAAADTGEQLSKLNVLLGRSSEELDDWSKTTAEAFSVSRREALTAAGTFATLFRGVGQSQSEAAKMSKALVELAGDMASFNNASPEQALEALGSALRGESEPIRAFGVLLDDATLKARAFTLGLVQSTKEALTPAIRVQAAYAEILAQTVVQQGDAARTSGSLANQQKELAARFNDAKAALGEGLLPIAQQIVGAISNGLLPAFEKAVPVIVEMAHQVGGLGTGFVGLLAPVSGVAAALGTFGVGALASGFALSQIAKGVEAAKTAFVAFQLATATLSGGLALLGAALGGIALVAFTAYAKESAEAKDRQQDLTEALSAAGDPAQGLVGRLNELTGALTNVEKTTEGATEGVKAVDAFFAQATAAADKTEESFLAVGVTAQDMADVTREGGGAFADAAQQALNLATGNSDLALATERASDAQAGIIRSLFAARDAGRLTDVQLGDMLNTLDKVSRAWDDTREAQIASIQGDVNKATSLQQVEVGWEAEQRAASGARDEYGQMLFVGAQLEEELGRVDASGRAAAGGIGSAGSTAAGTAAALGDVGTAAAGSVGGVGDLAAAHGDASDAAEAHDKALKALNDDIDAFIDATFGAQDSADKWAKSLAGLTEQVSTQKLDLKVTVSSEAGQASLDAMAAQAEADIKRLKDAGASAEEVAAAEAAAADALAVAAAGLGVASEENQAAFRGLVGLAQEEVQRLIESGAPLAEVAARTDELAAGLRQSAADMGITLDASTVAIEGNSAAALANRDAFRGLVDLAQQDIQRLIDSGASIEQVTTRANELADGVLATASQMGLSGPSVDGYVAGIRGIAETANDANAALAALPTDLQLNLTYTLGLNAEEFRAQLLEASRAFQDELSASYVELGIIEVPGASFALPRRASGGPVRAGEMYWVGEHGPEPFVPDVNGTVIANDKVSVLSGGGGGLQVGTINVTEAASPAHVVDEINARLGWMLTTRNER